MNRQALVAAASILAAFPLCGSRAFAQQEDSDARIQDRVDDLIEDAITDLVAEQPEIDASVFPDIEHIDNPDIHVGTQPPRVGDDAPMFRLKAFDGEQITDTRDFRGQRPMILFFGSYT